MCADNTELWQKHGPQYRELINDPDRDSYYLRQQGLIPTVKKLVGPCEGLTILDAGCGAGSFYDEFPGARLYECDADPNVEASKRPDFSQQDIRRMSYSDGFFDVVIVNYVLMWLPDIGPACRELFRVARPDGGRLILSMLHPYFYRAADGREVQEDGSYRIARDLSRPCKIAGHRIANAVGPLNHYYHRLDTYMNTLIQVGWTIRHIKDWYVDMDDYNAEAMSAKATIRRTGHVPLYCFLECARTTLPHVR